MKPTTNNVEKTEGAELLHVTLRASALGEAKVPGRIMISPLGRIESASGVFVMDEEAAHSAIAAFEAHGTDLPVDYEHQTLGGDYSSPTGQAPAAGWIKALQAVVASDGPDNPSDVPPGLWADVEWTSEGKSKLAGREYRYVSPVVLVRKDDRRVVSIHSVALTNKPAIAGMAPVVNTATHNENKDGSTVNCLTGLRSVLAMNESNADETVLIAAANRIRTLERAETHREALGRVERAMSAGKLTAAQKEWAIALAERSPEEFDRWEQVAPVVVSLGRTTPPARTEANAMNNRGLAEVAAREEWRRHHTFLEKLCSEDAFVANATRGCED